MTAEVCMTHTGLTLCLILAFLKGAMDWLSTGQVNGSYSSLAFNFSALMTTNDLAALEIVTSCAANEPLDPEIVPATA